MSGLVTPESRLAARPVVIFESLDRVANCELIYKTLDDEGVPRRRLVQDSVVLERTTKKIGRRMLAEGAEGLRERRTIARGSVVLLVGNTPLEAITGKKGIKQKRGRPFEHDGVLYLPVMPPGVALYDEKQLPMIRADLRLFADMCKKGEIPREEGLDWTIVDSPRKFREMLDDLHGTVSYDIETGRFDESGVHVDGALYPWIEGGRVVSIGFGTRNRQWCLPLNHPESTWPADQHQDLIDQICKRLRHCFLVAHNGKFDSLWLQVHYGVRWRCDFDTMLAHFMLDENARHGLKLLAQVYYGAPNYDADLDTKSGAGPIGKHCLYLAHDVYYTRKLRFTLGKLLARDGGVERVFERIMMPLASLFVDIEFHGVFVDFDRFEEAEVHLRDLLKKAHSDLYKILKKHGIDTERFVMDKKGRAKPLNLGSPKQLAKLFFEDLKIAVLDKTSKGKPSTNESVLLRIEHPAAEALIRWRGADQMLKMFIDGWRGFFRDGRLHPSFKLHGTVTHRASCEKPNLQQVPRESLIRSLIKAPPGWQLIEIDLSQIEMRIAAELSGDETLLGLFDRDEDVHWLTATREIGRGGAMREEVMSTARKWCAQDATANQLKKLGLTRKSAPDYSKSLDVVYRMGPDKAAEIEPKWKELRKKAKAINFGYLFGMWWKKFKIYARDNYGVTVTDREAQESRKTFFQLYPRLAEWHERQKRYARRHGHVRSLSGALRRLPDAMLDHDCPERGEAQRQAINSPVQEFACMLNYMALLQLCREFSWDVLRPIGTVHDCVLMEVRDDYVEKVYHRALKIMEHPELLDEFGIRMRVPIKGEAKVGAWSKGVSIEKYIKQREAA